MKKKLFREDLLHRLNVIHILITPLSDRKEDINLLSKNFLRKCETDLSQGEVYLSSETEQILNSYSWRGNIRELENVIKRAVVLARTGPILSEHLPDHLVILDQNTLEADDQLENRFKLLIQDYLLKNQEIQHEKIYENLIQLIEKNLFEVMLDKNFGKQISVAKALGINRNTLKRKIDAMKIDIKKKKPNN
jgi:DNA-binding NtrC family response regulator